MIRFGFSFLILFATGAAVTISFGNSPVEHVGRDSVDIVHCLIED
jgi:hypothetical protein